MSRGNAERRRAEKAQRRRAEQLTAEIRAARERRSADRTLEVTGSEAPDGPDASVRPTPTPEPSHPERGFGAAAGAASYDAMVRRCNAEFRRWRTPDFVPAKVMTDAEWAEVEPLLGHLNRVGPVATWEARVDSTRSPVLYAMTTGQRRNLGSLLARPTMKFDVLVEVFSDGAVRCTGWPHKKRKTARNIAVTERLRVANIGGVSLDHELIILQQGFPTFRIKAPEGSPAAATIDALNLDAAVHAGPRLYPPASPQPQAIMAYQPPEPTSEYTRRAMGLPRLKPLPPRMDRPRPEPRMVRDAAEAEALAAEWVRWLGWIDAAMTPPGADGGVDVSGRADDGVVAQVKFEAVKTGRPVLQALYGAGHGLGAKHWVFFSSAGYTTQAVAWADQVGMLLFRFTLDGSIEPVNFAARSRFGPT
ncbi:restriction endonuclease [Nocardioides sp. NPDC092400]|uniref:restriction endonuclease n=1 Tax=Nocardioides sp. NPDC092400 TaxID=3155196 RepID=UPI00341F01CC